MDLLCPVIIKKIKTKLKTMPNDLSPYAALILKKFLYKNKYFSFRKFVVLEPVMYTKNDLQLK